MTFCPAANFTQKMNGSCILRADLRFSYPEKNAILVALQKKQEENTMTYGYARVSAADQNLNRQLDDFLAFGVAREKIFCDKRSGKDFKRSSYLRLLKKLCPGIKIFGYSLRAAIACAMSCAFGAALTGILENYLTPFPSLVICGAVLAAFIAATFLIFKTYSVEPARNALKNRLKRHKAKLNG